MAELIFQTASGIALLGIILAFARFIKGPTAADRVVALDAMTIISISLIAFVACCKGRIIYIDVASVYALVSFLGVVAIARYLEGGL